ncbi:ribose-phosphate diphosphokinase [candidate division WOR-3 bacterium]|uniref:Ribose-phosphate pyrophosphokinase n=1 Tax=candidate division WOR-3 bacterium TaxID=2052148 RepID=A0A9D5K7M0_UNCW3|nr:ribose-phosphate diphosphokinase [candidate division WOR-3 bacterium]MBD3363594.1 ribose-phosphate diphosphokinase [candidate division WOR-3 bacterium]
MTRNSMKVFCGNSVPRLAQNISKKLGFNLGKVTVDRFSDGEIRVKIEENVRGADVFIIQSTQAPSDNLMELLLMCDAAKRASASRITTVIPYYGYARQDKKDEPRVPITAKLVADLLSQAGASRILALDLHAEQIQGFFDIPVDHLYATPLFAEFFGKRNLADYIVVAPDAGSAKRSRGYAKRMGNLPMAIVDKRREKKDKPEALNLVGAVEGKKCLLLDDLISTGTTLIEATGLLLKKGAKEVRVAATHGVFSGEAIEKLKASPIEEIVITDSLPRDLPAGKFRVLSIAGLLSEAIRRIHNGESVSSLFI